MIPRPDATEFTVEKLDSGEASLRDGFEIGRDSFVGDVTSNVVEPGLRIEHAIRLGECTNILLAEGGKEPAAVGNDRDLRGDRFRPLHTCHEEEGRCK